MTALNKDEVGFVVAALVARAEIAEAAVTKYEEVRRQLVALSQWIDRANAHRHPETNLWSRVSKASEEGGEAMDALRGYLGENPRKGVTGTLDDVVGELLDTAISALGAVEHIRGHDGQSLDLLAGKILRVHARAFGGEG